MLANSARRWFSAPSRVGLSTTVPFLLTHSLSPQHHSSCRARLAAASSGSNATLDAASGTSEMLVWLGSIAEMRAGIKRPSRLARPADSTDRRCERTISGSSSAASSPSRKRASLPFMSST